MIVIAGEFEIKPEKMNEAIAAAVEMQTETMKEAGCVVYRFYTDPENPNMIHLFEEWESEAHLAAHFQTPHMATFQKIFPDVRVSGEKDWIKKYVVSEAAPL